MTELMQAACKVAGFVNENKFAAIIVSGGSNQLSRSLLTLGWMKNYRHFRLPKIFVLPSKVNQMIKSADGIDLYRDWVKEYFANFLPELNLYK